MKLEGTGSISALPVVSSQDSGCDAAQSCIKAEGLNQSASQMDLVPEIVVHCTPVFIPENLFSAQTVVHCANQRSNIDSKKLDAM